MELIIELPSFTKKNVDKVVGKIVGKNIDVFIPENPAGKPALLAISTGVYLRVAYNVGVYASIRLNDINLLHAYSSALTASEFGFRGLTILKGDKPEFGKVVDEDSEETLSFIKNRIKNIRLGLIVSLRYGLDKIKQRISKRPDYIMVIHFGPGRMGDLKLVADTARDFGVKTYPFLLLGLEKSKGLFEELGQAYFQPSDIRQVCGSLGSIVDGVIISSPLDLSRAVDLVLQECI
ncbi:hypothetical protein ACSU1N_05045 [Thermogladius sp. 4427co]|uniref:hypothetical protein n=1 Tax=Thermogladius sp. 4427co TaxID=3450718 RepID=UPI003F79924F